MKNYKRAYRRFKQDIKFKQRIKKWTCRNEVFVGPEGRCSRRAFIEGILKGEYWTFLKNTGRPCSCLMCSSNKYKRKQKQYILIEAWKEINDMAP